VDGDGVLALVEPGPVDALAVVGHRPAVIVGGPTDGVDAALQVLLSEDTIEAAAMKLARKQP
ncbi:MAG: hypothetical protein QOF88_3100, partial [Mycobacterium sp.]|nr:hypothetical protein [Mycobacterium sp.]